MYLSIIDFVKYSNIKLFLLKLTFFFCYYEPTLNVDLIDTPGKLSRYSYPTMTKTMRQKDATKTFILHVEEGMFR